ncbi:TetR/AcrR family transcriptional regulator [Oenococcus sicerae]|uniref:TetR/AcrR family transcriptional regulator n=1 Tax=Oenococcus sicerae TaxID=2203724 RepID=A0ABX5QNF0_9LACO|nr:TetR/AcrR family transcriptional regulator [Oenococcus sicerae]QAS70307.1 TetR/AcrR family transcriptional regulator [Oenococcus sicerae]
MIKEADLNDLFGQMIHKMADLPPKQQRILAASLNLFAEKGFDKTTTEDIANAAQVAQGTVYRRFKTKDDLLAAVLTPILKDVFPQAISQFTGQAFETKYTNLHDFLTAIVTDRIHFIYENRQVLKIVWSQALTNSEMLVILRDRIGQAISEIVFPQIKKMQKQNLIIGWPADKILTFLAGTMFTFLTKLIIMPGHQIDLDSESDFMIRFLEEGLAANGDNHLV